MKGAVHDAGTGRRMLCCSALRSVYQTFAVELCLWRVNSSKAEQSQLPVASQ